jgi:hypothetical protein
MSSRKRTPDQEPAKEETGTAVAEPPAAANDNGQAANDNQPSFAQRVGQRKYAGAPDPFGVASDSVAGVRLFYSDRDEQVAIKFGEGRPEDKPSQQVIDKLKENGYRWQPGNRIWAHAYGDRPMTVRIEAERLYQEIRQMVRQEKGIETSPEIPF